MTLLRGCAWCVVPFIICFGLGWFVVADFFPLHHPSADADTVAAIFQQDSMRIRLGCALMWIGCVFFMPFMALITIQMRRIDHPAADVLALTQGFLGSIGSIFVALPTLMWVIAAFRPDRAPEITQMLNDFAWITIVAPAWPIIAQGLTIGVATLADRAATPVFPRWFGYMSIWVALLSLPAFLAIFFYSGAFAWNGFIGFWLPLSAFGTYFWVLLYVVLKSISQLEDQ